MSDIRHLLSYALIVVMVAANASCAHGKQAGRYVTPETKAAMDRCESVADNVRKQSGTGGGFGFGYGPLPVALGMFLATSVMTVAGSTLIKHNNVWNKAYDKCMKRAGYETAK